MSVTVANVITNLDTYIGDTSTDRISQAERFQAITEATAWLLEALGNDHAVKTYDLNYYDTINYYKVTTPLSDLLASADLRRAVNDQTISALPKSSRDMAEDIGQGSTDFAWGIERKNGNSYLAITLDPKRTAKFVEEFDSVGSWTADTSTSDATNVTLDNVEYQSGSGSLNFDVDVSQSGNNRATIYNDSFTAMDLSEYEDLGAWIFDVYLPDVTNFSSITFYWGSSSTSYWSATVTTDIDGTAFANGWNKIKINWSDATATSSPDEDEIDYLAFQFNYTGSQLDDTDFRIDNLRLANPEKLTFHYVSWDVGESNSGTDLTAFTATTDVPFFSGQYDQYRYSVAHKAAAIIFYALRLREEAQFEEREAERSLDRLRKIFPTSKVAESHNFKVRGINFSSTARGRRRFRGY